MGKATALKAWSKMTTPTEEPRQKSCDSDEPAITKLATRARVYASTISVISK